jgi:uncharacterized protein
MENGRQGDVLKIRISGLSNGLHNYHFSSDPDEIGLAENFKDPIVVDAVLEKSQRQMLLRANVQTSGLFNCDRCIEEFHRPISSAYAMMYIYDERDRGKYPDDELQILDPSTVAIDLTEDVRQIVLLSVPMKLLCKEDCKGLCPQCGTNWNVSSCTCQGERMDQRWHGLEGLLNN